MSTDVNQRLKSDCVDFIIHLVVGYYQSMSAEIPTLYIPERDRRNELTGHTIVVDFYDPRFKNNPEAYLKRLKSNIGANVVDLSTSIPEENVIEGDFLYMDGLIGHAGVVYHAPNPDELPEKQWLTGDNFVTWAQGSGLDYHGTGAGNTSIQPIAVHGQDNGYPGSLYRMNLIDVLPNRESYPEMEKAPTLPVKEIPRKTNK